MRDAPVTAVADELRGESVEAFVVLTSGGRPGDELSEELRDRVKQLLAAHLCPHAVHFRSSLPRTSSRHRGPHSNVTANTGLAELVQRAGQRALGAFRDADVAGVRHRLTAGATDQVDHFGGGAFRPSGSVRCRAEVVDDDLGAAPADSTACDRPRPLPALVTIAALP
ncbi:AMP-binding enzyme [Streptomyces luteireticuli]|uniref:AMP-binding enzyme n=1 Tax=Streptomyces luteireticuli TaxID=173858 RepID=UPI0031D4726A